MTKGTIVRLRGHRTHCSAIGWIGICSNGIFGSLVPCWRWGSFSRMIFQNVTFSLWATLVNLKIIIRVFKGGLFSKNEMHFKCGRHLVDIIGDISWTKEVTSRGHFWWHFVDTFVHEKSSFWVTFRGHFWVTFRGHFLGEFLWPFIKQLTNPNLT